MLSEDVDTLMFGSGVTLRNWSPEGSLKTRMFTHVNVYDARKTREGKSGLDRAGMILVALMSGGDYLPEGIPGCGPKTACEAARAGFGEELTKLGRKDQAGLTAWKVRLCHELRTNESKLFKQKHRALIVPEDFPRTEVLKYYTQPVVSTDDKIEKLRETLTWDQDIEIEALRSFVGDAFDWVCVSGAKKFVRNLAPALLVRNLRLRAESEDGHHDDPRDVAQQEATLVRNIHMRRQHVSTDKSNELRIGFVPLDLVPLDLSAEEPDPELPVEDSDSEDEALPAGDDDESVDPSPAPTGPRKKRTPPNFDPTQMDKIWIMETFVKVGVPLKFQDWDGGSRNTKKSEAARGIRSTTEKKTTNKKAPEGGMPNGALDRFTRVTKPGVNIGGRKPKRQTPKPMVMVQHLPSHLHKDREAISPASNVASRTGPTDGALETSRPVFRIPPLLPASFPPTAREPVINLLSSSPSHCASPRKRTLQKLDSDTSAITLEPADQNHPEIEYGDANHRSRPSKPKLVQPSSTSPSRRGRKRSPLRRTATVPPTLDEDDEESDCDTFILPPAKRPNMFDRTDSALALRNLRRKSSASPIPEPDRQPSTKWRTKQDKTNNIIEITSSPLQQSPHSQPATPSSALKPRNIANWLTKSPTRLPKSVLPTREERRTNSPALDEEAEAPDTPSPRRIAPVPEKPPKPRAKQQPAKAKNDKPVCASKNPLRGEETQTGHPTSDLTRGFKLPRGLNSVDAARLSSASIVKKTQASWKQRQAGKRKVRLRESLEGAWASFEDDDEGPADDSVCNRDCNDGGFLRESPNGGNRGKAKGQEASGKSERRAKEWRLSQLEVLDLTALT